jgi:hypothetical protein
MNSKGFKVEGNMSMANLLHSASSLLRQAQRTDAPKVFLLFPLLLFLPLGVINIVLQIIAIFRHIPM